MRLQKIPLYVMTLERPDYFRRMFHSLCNSISFDEVTVYIVDDGSKDEAKLQMLGILDKFSGIRIIRNKKPVGTKQLLANIWRHFVEHYDFDFCIHLQDDIVFHSQWLLNLLKVKDNIPNLGILTPWDRRNWPNEKKGDGWILRNPKNGACKIGGVAWLTSRAFIEKILALNERYRGHGEDSAFQCRCYDMGFNVAATVPSWVDHFGVESIAHRGKKRTASSYRAWNFVGEKHETNSDSL